MICQAKYSCVAEAERAIENFPESNFETEYKCFYWHILKHDDDRYSIVGHPPSPSVGFRECPYDHDIYYTFTTPKGTKRYICKPCDYISKENKGEYVLAYRREEKNMSIYHQIANEIADILEEKNKSYGSSFEKSGEIIKILYPDGIPEEKYTDLLVITRIIDKLFRIANNKDAFAEDPWKDIAGYALLMCANEKNKIKIKEN